MIKVVLNETLKKKGKTKYWVSKHSNISTNALSQLANNKTTAISFDNLATICNLLDCNIEDILIYVK